MKRIPFPLHNTAEKFGDQPALISDERTITYAECCRLVNAAAGNLIQRRIAREDRLGIVANNSIEYVLLLMALFQIGAVACPVSPRFPKKTIAAMLDKIDCTKIVTGPYYKSDSDKCTNIELPPLWDHPKISTNGRRTATGITADSETRRNSLTIIAKSWGEFSLSTPA